MQSHFHGLCFLFTCIASVLYQYFQAKTAAICQLWLGIKDMEKKAYCSYFNKFTYWFVLRFVLMMNGCSKQFGLLAEKFTLEVCSLCHENIKYRFCNTSQYTECTLSCHDTIWLKILDIDQFDSYCDLKTTHNLSFLHSIVPGKFAAFCWGPSHPSSLTSKLNDL